MRLYENLVTTNLVLFDLPSKNSDHAEEKYFEKIFRQLLIYDQLPDSDLEAVMQEAEYSLATDDPSFEILFHNDYERYISAGRHAPRWNKIKKDYGYYIDSEMKRRNKYNPYHVAEYRSEQAWNSVPDFSRQKSNQPWQFDYLYRDAQRLCGEVYELTKNVQNSPDKDEYRARINAILVPDKLIFALNSGENLFDFVEAEVATAGIKMSLDAYKLAYMFLNRVIESLHKMRWKADQTRAAAIDESIALADHIQERLLARIGEVERRFILFLDSFIGQESY